MKLCKDCKHVRAQVCFVSGEKIWVDAECAFGEPNEPRGYCQSRRSNDPVFGACGPEAKLWEAP